jgi:hypothetical protein
VRDIEDTAGEDMKGNPVAGSNKEHGGMLQDAEGNHRVAEYMTAAAE